MMPTGIPEYQIKVFGSSMAYYKRPVFQKSNSDHRMKCKMFNVTHRDDQILSRHSDEGPPVGINR